MSTVILKRNDEGFKFTYNIKDEQGAIVDLTNTTVNLVIGDKTNVIINKPAIIESATNGTVSFTFSENDTLFDGNFLAEFVVTFSETKKLTYPRSGYILVNLQPNVDYGSSNISIDSIAAKQGDFENKLDQILAQSTDINEVIDSRGTYVTLGSRLNNIDTQLADTALNGSLVGYRHKINVEDIMTKHGFTTLQQVFDFIPNNTELHFSKMYEVSAEVVLAKSAIKFVGDIAPTYGNGAGIKNIGTGNALRITGSKFEAEQFCVHGNGDVYNFGAGATGQHGIVFDASTVWFLNRCQIIAHGGHGIFSTNGVWNCRINQCLVVGNVLDGINSQSTGSAGNQQNGNNVVITGSIIGSCGGNGINWRATQLTVYGNDISGSKGSGLLIDLTGANAVVGGIDFRGNYVENNKNGQIRVISTSTYGLRYMIAEGNYFNASYEGSGPTSLLVFSGQTYKNNYIDIGNNNYSTLGSYVINYVDGGDTLLETCSVYRTNTATAFVNLGLAKLNIAGIKTRVVNGLSNQKSLAWATPQKSDNVYTSGIDTYFSLPVTEGEILKSFSAYVESDTTSSYDVSLNLYEKDETGSQTWASIGSATQTFSSGGSNLANFSPSSTIRVKQGKTYFLRVIVAKPATGSTLYLHNLKLSVV